MPIADILLIISAFANLFLSLFVLFRTGNRDYKKITLGSLAMGVVFWCTSLFFYRFYNDIELITFWGKLAHVWGAILGTLFLCFVLFFINKANRKILLVISTAFVLLAILILGTDWIVGDAYIKHGINNIEIFFGYYLFIFYINIHFFIAFFLLIKRYILVKGIEREQIKYILIGTMLSAIMAVTFDVIYPLFVDFSLNWIGPVVTIVMVVSMTYAIVKYRLMNIRLILGRGFLYAILVGAVAAFFALSVLVVGNAIGGNSQTSKIITYIVNSFIVVIFLDPVKRVWAKITDKIFFKDKIDYQEVLRQVSNVVAREIDLAKLLGGTVELLAKKLKVEKINVYIPDSHGNFYFITSSDEKKASISLDRTLGDYIKIHKTILIIDELIRDLGNLDESSEKYKKFDTFIKLSEKNDIEMFVPVVEKDNITAIFLFGNKQSGDLYAQEDINFLEVLTPQIATAIEKSKLYEEVEEFNRELQKKVEDRTKSLREVNLALEERNKFLTTIQVVTNMISRTLNLKKVNQMIADSIAREVGYIGGMLSFVDSSGQYLKVGAITNNEQSRKAFHILSQEPRDYTTKVEADYNLGAQTFLTGKINFSDKMSDFLCPPVAKQEIDKIQELLKIKTIVGVPIFSEAKIIGVIHFYLAVTREKISSLDIEIMTALANQVGLVSRNLKLYNTLQHANAELQDANTRLRELDKAKSEFLSIASHQLRTPISAIKGYLSMMIDGDFGKLPKNISDVIKNIFESSARLARLINIFLNVSRIESGRLKLEKKPIQINDLIKSVIIELINQAKQKGLKLEYDKKKKAPPLILADPDKLREVVLNLVDNAIKYTPEGSIIITVDNDKENLNFKVTDTGIGIKQEEVKTLFRKFVRGSGVAQIHTGGSGLGLFIAQKIIKEHNGHVWAESEGQGKGSVFQFTVPIYNGQEVHEAPAYKEEAKKESKEN